MLLVGFAVVLAAGLLFLVVAPDAPAPTLPLEGQVEAIQHMVNLPDDEQYKPASQMLMNPSLRPEIREVLFSDAPDRPNSVKLQCCRHCWVCRSTPRGRKPHANLQLVHRSGCGEERDGLGPPGAGFSGPRGD